MTKIVRRPDKATGGITPKELEQLREHSKLWIKCAFRTNPIDPTKIIPAIEGLYKAAGLKKPRVVIVPSPLVMAFAYGASSAIWASTTASATSATNAATEAATRAATRGPTYAATRAAIEAATRAATEDATYAPTYAATRAATEAATHDATDAATRAATSAATCDAADAATRAATYDATDAATRAATSAATYLATRAATRAATYDATDAATRDTSAATYLATRAAADACYQLAGKKGLFYAQQWHAAYQGGNMWAAYECYLTSMRDIIGLDLPSYQNYKFWEMAAIEGSFRVMHPEFCIVSDFPLFIKTDREGRPHCDTGPSHRWRDGWELYYWHGVRVPEHWIVHKNKLTAGEVLREGNLEVRRVGCEILGWNTLLRELNAITIDRDNDPEIGTLVEVKLPDLERPSRFLRVRCGTGREFAIGVPATIKTVLDAQAWVIGLNPSDFKQPEIRT